MSHIEEREERRALREVHFRAAHLFLSGTQLNAFVGSVEASPQFWWVQGDHLEPVSLATSIAAESNAIVSAHLFSATKVKVIIVHCFCICRNRSL